MAKPDTATLLLSSLRREIESARRQMIGQRAGLEREGLWLFLAAMGCAALASRPVLQGLAFAVTVTLFALRCSDAWAQRSSLTRSCRALRDRVRAEVLSDRVKRELLEEIDSLRGATTMWKAEWRLGAVMALAWGFLGAAGIYSLR
jgi:hypothetical protein